MILTVEVTHDCWLDCIHCSTRPMICVEHLSLYKDVMGEIRVGEVVLSGGEPLLYSGLRAYVIESVEKRIPISLMTSGYYLSLPTGVDFDDFRTIWVSVYGNRALHESVTQVQGSFVRTLETICKLVEEGHDVRIQTPLIYPSCATSYKVAEMFNIPVRFKQVLYHGRAGMRKDLSRHPVEDQLAWAESARDRYDKVQISSSLNGNCRKSDKITISGGRLLGCVAEKTGSCHCPWGKRGD